MSAADVKFFAEDGDPARPGHEVEFTFTCPNGNRCGGLLIKGRTQIPHDPKGQNGGVPQWGWDGDVVTPTFTPSIDCKGCWHGYIEKGRCVDVQHVDEPERKKKDLIQ